MRTTIRSYRGETRGPITMIKHGGMVPKYLLETHNKGFEGFIDCTDKREFFMGCRCANHGESMLYYRAKKMLLSALADPSILQKHVIWNTVGFLSTAKAADDAYFGHNYQITTECYELGLLEAAEKYGQDNSRFWRRAKKFDDANSTGYPPKAYKDYKVYLDDFDLDEARVMGMTPRGGVEITYISPIMHYHVRWMYEKT